VQRGGRTRLIANFIWNGDNVGEIGDVTNHVGVARGVATADGQLGIDDRDPSSTHIDVTINDEYK
jgi:hypothetical protein